MIEFPLDLPEVRVLKTELKKREIVITVESTRPYAIRSRCGQKTFEFHSYGDPIRLRHLPILEQRVFIELRPKRFRWPTCDDHPTTTQQCDWYEPRSPHTKAIDQSLLRQLINSTVSDVARKQEVSYDSVMGAINRGVDAAVNWGDFTELKVIGMDAPHQTTEGEQYLTSSSLKLCSKKAQSCSGPLVEPVAYLLPEKAQPRLTEPDNLVPALRVFLG
jgi:hypothetical protein